MAQTATTPYKVVPGLGPAQARALLGRLAATPRPEYSTPDKEIYWSGRLKIWAQVTRGAGGTRTLSLFRGCPC